MGAVLMHLADTIARTNQGGKLPSMELGTFGGDHSLFPAWWDNFYALVHSKSMAAIVKLNHLVKSLTGPAAAVAHGYRRHGDSYPMIVRRLKAKYGSRRLILSLLIRRALFKPQATTMAGARGMLDFLWAMVRQLESEEISFDDPAANLMILSVFTSKIPEELLQKWELHLGEREEAAAVNMPEPPAAVACAPLHCVATVEQFLQYCETRVLAVESAGKLYATGAQRQPEAKKEEQKKGGGQAAAAPKPAAAATPKPAPAAGSSKKEKKRFTRKEQAVRLNGLVQGEQEDSTVLAAPQPKQDKTIAHFTSGCMWCGANHAHANCKKYKDFPIDERWTRLRTRSRAEGPMCYQCYGPHKIPECTGPACGIDGCTRTHHKQLHTALTV
jgi:Protein of unknown function (DUF1759)